MGLVNDEKSQLERVESVLLSRFGEQLPPDAICAEVESAMHDFDSAPIRTYVPVLLQKRVTDALRARTIQLPH